MTTSTKVHPVTLLAPTGKQQYIVLKLAKNGVHLVTADDSQKEINRFPYEVIRKWLPAHLRSKNPGSDDCLDLQIETDKGPRDLRMRCENAATVKQIIQDLRDIVQGIMEEHEVQQRQNQAHSIQQQEPQPGLTNSQQYGHSLPTNAQFVSPPGYTASTTPTYIAVPGAGGSTAQVYVAQPTGLTVPVQSGQAFSSSILDQFMSRGQTQGNIGDATAAELELTSRVNSFQPVYMNTAYDPMSAAVGGLVSSDLRRDAELSSPTIHAQGMLAGPLSVHPSLRAARDGVAIAEDPQLLGLQVKHLEELVKQLSMEVSKRSAAPPSIIDASSEGTLDDAPSPIHALIRDPRALAPVVSVYEQRIQALETELKSRTSQMESVQARVEEVVLENDQLRDELSKAQEARALATVAANGGATSLIAEELELLRQENDLLVAQQKAMEGELSRLHAKLDDSAKESMRLAQDHAASLSQAQQYQAKCQELESKTSRLQSALKIAESDASTAGASLAAVRAAAEQDRASAAAAQAALEELQRTHRQLQSDMAGLKQRSKVAFDSHASMQVELGNLRDKHEASMREAAASRQEGERLRQALGAMEARVLEYQRKDAEVYIRIKEAMEMAEEARLSRDAMSAMQQELQSQIDSLTQKLATARQQARAGADEEWNKKLEAAEQHLHHAQQEAATATKEVSEYRARCERLERDKRSLQQELNGLKEDVGDSLDRKGRISMMSITAMDKIQNLERERDEAVQKLESMTRKLERSERDWQLEKQTMEQGLRALKQYVAELEGGVTLGRNEGAGLRRQLEAVQRELQALRKAKTQSEAELRQQIAAVRAEKDREVASAASRLEASLRDVSLSAAQAEKLLAAKEHMLLQWREEAQAIAIKLEAALSEHRRELEAKQLELDTASQQATMAAQEQQGLVAGMQELQVVEAELRAALEDSETRTTELHMHLIASQQREEELMQEIRALQSLIERTRFEHSQQHRAMDPLAHKYDALKKDIREATALSASMAYQAAAQ